LDHGGKIGPFGKGFRALTQRLGLKRAKLKRKDLGPKKKTKEKGQRKKNKEKRINIRKKNK
jgi:hypothetical protein